MNRIVHVLSDTGLQMVYQQSDTGEMRGSR